jgi:hypothetical protein
MATNRSQTIRSNVASQRSGQEVVSRRGWSVLLGVGLAMLTAACAGPTLDPDGTLDDCWTCHGDRYQAATSPDHVASGYPTDCGPCHGKTGWRPAEAEAHKPDGSFPLTGGHVDLACADCHGESIGPVADPSCAGCHLDDFQTANNPDHRTLGLPTTCDLCHTAAGWSPADFSAFHTFPLSTGRHTGLACSACHPAGNAWADFSCITCHEHERQRMDDKHLGEVSGYQYESQACYTCHPRGLVQEGN